MKNKNLWLFVGGLVVIGLSQNASANCFIITPTSGRYLATSTINPSGVKGSATVDTNGIDGLKEFNNKNYDLKDLGKSCEEARETSTGLVKIGLYVSHFSEQMDTIFAKDNIKEPGLKLLQIYSRQTQWLAKFGEYDFKDQTSWDEISTIMEEDSVNSFGKLLPKMSDDRIVVWSLLLAIVGFDNGIHDIYY